MPHGDDHLIGLAGGTRVRLWSPVTNTVVREFALAKGEIVSRAVHSDGERVLLSCGTYTGPRSTRDTLTGELLAEAEDIGDSVAAVGSLPATAGPEGRPRFWDPASGGHVRDAAGHHRGWRKASGGIDAMSAATGHPHAVTSIAADDRVLISTDPYEIHRRNVRTGAPLGVSVPEEVDTVQHAFVLANGRTLAADRHFDTRVWDPATGERVSVVRAPFVRVEPLIGRRAVDGSVRHRRRRRHAAPVGSREGRAGRATSSRSRPSTWRPAPRSAPWHLDNDQSYTVAAHDGVVTVRDLNARKRIVTAEAAGVTRMTFTPDGLLVLAGRRGWWG